MEKNIEKKLTYLFRAQTIKIRKCAWVFSVKILSLKNKRYGMIVILMVDFHFIVYRKMLWSFRPSIFTLLTAPQKLKPNLAIDSKND